MTVYTDADRSKDFHYFISINKDFFAEHGHKYVAIRNLKVLDYSDSKTELIKRMKSKSYEIGSYILQNCTGDESGYTVKLTNYILIDKDKCQNIVP